MRDIFDSFYYWFHQSFFSFSKIVKFHTEDPLSKSHLKYTVKGCKTYDAKYKRYGDLKEVTFEVSRTKQQWDIIIRRFKKLILLARRKLRRQRKKKTRFKSRRWKFQKKYVGKKYNTTYSYYHHCSSFLKLWQSSEEDTECKLFNLIKVFLFRFGSIHSTLRTMWVVFNTTAFCIWRRLWSPWTSFMISQDALEMSPVFPIMMGIIFGFVFHILCISSNLCIWGVFLLLFVFYCSLMV